MQATDFPSGCSPSVGDVDHVWGFYMLLVLNAESSKQIDDTAALQIISVLLKTNLVNWSGVALFGHDARQLPGNGSPRY